MAKLISGCLSVPDGVSNSSCFTEEQKALHCPPQPTLWAWPPPTDPELTAAGQSAPNCPSLEGNGEVSCHLQKRFVTHCLCRHHPSPERHPNTCTAPRVLPEVSTYLKFYSHARQKMRYLLLILFSLTNGSLHTSLPMCSIPVLSYFLPVELSLFTKDKERFCGVSGSNE